MFFSVMDHPSPPFPLGTRACGPRSRREREDQRRPISSGTIFVSSPPKHAPSLLANWFKGISSRKYNHRYADHDGEKIGWVRGYYAGTAGHVSSETVKNYIQRHEEDES